MNRQSNRREDSPTIKERKRITRLAYAMMPTEMARWERSMAETIERLTEAGWEDADYWQLGHLRRELERQYLLDPEESARATRVLRPNVLLDMLRWLRGCSPEDLADAATYVYRTYARLPVDEDLIKRMYPALYADDADEVVELQ